MSAIETLMDEHRLILRALDALEVFATRVEQGAPEDRLELARFARFLREYADVHHHAKEEEILFAAMVRAGFPAQSGPIAVMLVEHGAGRAHVAILTDRSEDGATWEPEDREAIVDAARGVAGLLRGHIAKEDQALYPMAVQHLDGAAMSAVELGLERRDARTAERAAMLRALGLELVQRHTHPHP